MSTISRWLPHREAASAGGAWAPGLTGDGHAGQVRGGIAGLDVLAVHMRARGWTAYISTPAGRLACLFVQDPHDCAECGDIIAAPDGTTGDWWYWFSGVGRIASSHAPAAAADAIIRAFQRSADSPPGCQRRSWRVVMAAAGTIRPERCRGTSGVPELCHRS